MHANTPTALPRSTAPCNTPHRPRRGLQTPGRHPRPACPHARRAPRRTQPPARPPTLASFVAVQRAPPLRNESRPQAQNHRLRLAWLAVCQTLRDLHPPYVARRCRRKTRLLRLWHISHVSHVARNKLQHSIHGNGATPPSQRPDAEATTETMPPQDHAAESPHHVSIQVDPFYYAFAGRNLARTLHKSATASTTDADMSHLPPDHPPHPPLRTHHTERRTPNPRL